MTSSKQRCRHIKSRARRRRLISRALQSKTKRDSQMNHCPLAFRVKDGSGVETLTVADLAEGIELSLGTSQGSTGWVVSARDLDKTFIGTRQDFVGVMDATVTLRSPLGKRLDRQVIRFEWGPEEARTFDAHAWAARTDARASAIGSRTDRRPDQARAGFAQAW